MATLGSARVLCLHKEIGSLETGKKADLITISTEPAHAVPMYNVYSHLVYALKGGDVRLSVINGQVAMLDGIVLTLDGGKVKQRARIIQERVLSSLKSKCRSFAYFVPLRCNNWLVCTENT